jgi:hypothetical protein
LRKLGEAFNKSVLGGHVRRWKLASAAPPNPVRKMVKHAQFGVVADATGSSVGR